MLTLPNYHIVSQIYESANSVVYRGLSKTDNQPVILKMLRQDYPTPAELTRYRQEYEIIHDLDLTGVINVYGIEKYQNTLVIILEDFEAESLKQLMTNRPFTIKEFLPLAIQMADSLGYIHAANIIHKDINPSNLVWEPVSKELKIIDFGIASLLARENPTLKNPEQLEGTLAYLSPEQTGRINRSIDYRTDLYSLGVTFYEMLTGQVPFSAIEAMELVHCHIAKTPTPLSDVNSSIPPIISDIVMKLMAKNAEERYQSAFGVKADLEKCLENLERFGNLEGFDFQLAQTNDFSGKLQIPQKLYGREQEVNTLLQTFERVSQGAVELMLVAGYSGVGKSALVLEVHKPMTKKRGYFAAGKFDQFQKNIPYSAITQAFNEFCRYLLMGSAETLGFWQTKLLKALGNNGQIIIDVIPDLERVIGTQPLVATVTPSEAQNRFRMCFLNFVKALSDKEHPFILFLDDLQWVDLASLELLKGIMLDDEIKHLLIIGAYRDNEVDATHPLMIMREELQDITVNTLPVPNLSLIDVNTLIADALKTELVEVQTLAQLVYQKTHGNAFFTHEFLKSLYDDALLVFDRKAPKWQWDVAQIAAKGMADNVVELMAGKIRQLPTETQTVLKLAACIGNQFQLKTLSVIYQHSQHLTLTHSEEAITEGLIIPLDSHYKWVELLEDNQARFKFQHDRVQQTAYSIIDDEQKKIRHLEIGQLLLKELSEQEQINRLFELVDHLNKGSELITKPNERIALVQKNLIAGQKAKNSSAYQPAFSYLQQAINILTADSAELAWQTHYDLTLTVSIEASEAAYLSGYVDKMAMLIETVLQHAKTLADKLRVYEVKIQSLITQNQLPEAVNTGLLVLELLGIRFPKKPNKLKVMLAVLKTKLNLIGKQAEDLTRLPTMTDADTLTAMRVMSQIIPAAHQTAPDLWVLIVLKQVNLSIKYGNTALSVYAYSVYATLLTAVVGEIETGYQFGKLALYLLEKLNANEHQAKTMFVVNNFVKHWKMHLNESLVPLREAYQHGLETGDLAHAGYSAAYYVIYSYTIGKELNEVEAMLANYSQMIAKLNQENALVQVQPYHQTVLNLLGKTDNPSGLDGKICDEKTLLPYLSQANYTTAICILYANKLMLCYLFGQYQQAVENARLAENYLDGAIGLPIGLLLRFYDSLARLALYNNATKKQQQQHLKKVRANQQKLKKWASHAPMNFLHKHDLVAAEQARVLGQIVEAENRYEQAINGAAANEYIQEEALAYELAGKFYLAQNKEKIAKTYLPEAHYSYQLWGAERKVKDLEQKYPQLLGIQETENRESLVTATMTRSTVKTQRATSTLLDLSSVTKASQALAEEIVLSRLLEKMMQTVIENAGAERGLLILENEWEMGKAQREPSKNTEWVIQAEGILNQAKVTVLQALPIEGHLPAAIVNYVARTRKSVVLANAMSKGIYTEDSYIRQHQLKSILCSPILHQGQLIGVLYLENNLIEGAFTPARLKIVDMLSSQAAISIENALLYRTLEQKVEKRTAQLAEANTQLAKTNTQLAEANEEITALNEQLQEENLRMSAELNVSRQLQQMLLPTEQELQQIDLLDIAGFMEPADEVGGDYYDVLQQQGRILFGIGDVTGHGLESGALAIMVQSSIRTLLANNETDPVKFFSALNQMVFHNIQRMNVEKNLTLVLVNYQDNQLYVSGQHEEMIVIRQGELELLDTVDLGFPIGLEEDIAEFVHQTKVPLNTGDVVVFYTDGITEAENIDGVLYGQQRLCEVIQQNGPKTAQQIQQAVIEDVRQFIGKQKVFDDMTLLILKQK